MPENDFHAAALAAVRDGKRIPPIKENDPQPGWYRVHNPKLGDKDDPSSWVGVLIAWDGDDDEDEEIVVFVAGKAIEKAENAHKIWTSCARHPISEAQYKDWKKTKAWPTEPQKQAKGGRGIGDNSRPAGICPTALDAIREAEDTLAGVKAIANETLAQKVAGLKNRLTEAWDNLEAERKKKNEPHDEAVKDNNKRYAEYTASAKKLKELSIALLAKFMEGDSEGTQRLSLSPGPGSRTVTLQKRYDAEVISYEEAWVWAKDDPKVQEAIQASAQRQVRAASGALRLAGVKNTSRSTVV